MHPKIMRMKAEVLLKLLAINKKLLIPLLITVTIALMICAGLFLFKPTGNKTIINSPQNSIITPETSAKKAEDYIRYSHISTDIGGKQEINILSIDLKNSPLTIRPVLSFDSLFGFEKLSTMVGRYKTYAAVNAGFFYEYGEPAGMVAINGKLLTQSNGKFPVFIYDGQKPKLEEIKTNVWLVHNGSKLEVSGLNVRGTKGAAVVYTPEYGQTNRAELPNVSIEIRNGKISKTDMYKKEAYIPEDGMLISFYQPFDESKIFNQFKLNDKVDIATSPELNKDYQAYECGSWLIKNGEIVVPEKDEWIGIMSNQDPRTAIGIMKDDSMILITVDGRQPGYSKGLTGKQLAQFLLEYGAVDAAMLDGGASTEMIINGRLVNKPSFKGEERLLGGGLMIMEK